MQIRSLYTLLIIVVISIYGCKSSGKISSGKKTEAISKIDALSGKERLQFDQSFYSGLKEKILGNTELASSHFQQCLKLVPDHSATLFELANIFEEQGKIEQALAFAKKASEIERENEWYALLLAHLYESAGRFDESAVILEKLSENSPHKMEYYYEWANALIYAGNYEEAISVYDKLEEKMGVTEEISEQKERLYLRLNDYEKAAMEIEQLIESNPGEAKYYGMLAELYQSAGKKEQALKTYRKLEEIDPDNPYVHLSLAEYYRDAGKNEQSYQSLKKAFSNPELDIDTKVHILLSYYTITETFSELKDQAFELNHILTEVHPDNAKSHAILGDFLYRDGRLNEARDAYRKALDLEKSKFAIWNQLLIIESELMDVDAMLEESAEAMTLFPVQPSFYLFNGIANAQKKNHEQAVKVLSEGKELVFDNELLSSQFYANLGDAYHALKDYAKADSSYEKSIKLYPENVYVLNNYSYYLSLREQNLERAEYLAKRANKLEPGVTAYMDTYGWILYKMKRYEEAKTWIEKAIHQGADTGVIYEHYGDVLFRLNDQEGALKYWKKAKEAGDASDLLNKKIADKNLHE